MVAARWRLRRIGNIETALLSTELVRRAEDIDEEFENMKNVDRLAWVFQKLADHGQTLSLVLRYEGAISRSYDRAFKQLLLLQSTRRRLQPNEPKPDPDPTPVTPRSVNPIPEPPVPETDADPAPDTPGIAEPGPDPAPNSPPSPPPSSPHVEPPC